MDTYSSEISASAEGALRETEADGVISRHFSHFRDLRLADARLWPDSPHACLPPSAQLAALMEGAARLFPQLLPAGAEELAFAAAECPAGVTREGRTRCRVVHDQPDRPQCRAELFLRDLMPNGRARQSYSLTCAARILPAMDPASAPILPDQARAPASASAAAAGRWALRDFYERRTGFGPGFRLLTELNLLEEKRLLARMRVPAGTEPAGSDNAGLHYPADAFEAAAQAMLVLALKRNVWQNIGSRMALLRVSAAYFLRLCIPGETLELELRDNADDPHTFHCDADVRDARGGMVLALRGMRPGVE